MTDLLKERLRERMLDARDWFEIRPDPHWWPALGIPGVVALCYFTVPHNLFPFLLAAAVMLAVLMSILAVLGIVAFVCGRAIGDVLDRIRSTPRARHNNQVPTLRRALQ